MSGGLGAEHGPWQAPSSPATSHDAWLPPSPCGLGAVHVSSPLLCDPLPSLVLFAALLSSSRDKTHWSQTSPRKRVISVRRGPVGRNKGGRPRGFGDEQSQMVCCSQINARPGCFPALCVLKAWQSTGWPLPDRGCSRCKINIPLWGRLHHRGTKNCCLFWLPPSQTAQKQRLKATTAGYGSLSGWLPSVLAPVCSAGAWQGSAACSPFPRTLLGLLAQGSSIWDTAIVKTRDSVLGGTSSYVCLPVELSPCVKCPLRSGLFP